MKIGIVASWFDMMFLFKIFQKYDFQYYVYRDWNNSYYQDKWYNFFYQKVKEGFDFLDSLGVDKIIVPPVLEFDFYQEEKLFPLFRRYLWDCCLPNSLVGKIWFIGDFADMEVIEDKFSNFTKDYDLTPNQKNVKKFCFPFAVWKKKVYLWKFFLNTLSFRSWLVNNVIKHDLRYFKDASVDTLIPLNYWYFAFEKSIVNKINTNKIRFQRFYKIEEIFGNYMDWVQDQYKVTIYSNWITDFLFQDKKWEKILTRGWKEDINIKEVSN